MGYKKNGVHGQTGRFLRDVVLPLKGNECLMWPFGVSSSGYGMMQHDGSVQLVQRVICTEAHGEPPTKTHQAAHSCGNRLCCNPSHIRWATRIENEADKLIHGSRIRGAAHVGAKLTDRDVREILAIGRSQTYRVLSERYGVSQGVISRILQGKSWPHIERAAA
jgi:hypothetical protein